MLRAMKIKLQNELLLLNVLTILLIVIISFVSSNVLRIILGLPLLLFFPGYTLLAALFPRRDGLGSVKRVALSFGLSIAVVPLIGLILNYTPWGITLYPILISITIFILATSVIAYYRRYRLGEVERFTVSLNFSLTSWRRQRFVDNILSVILIAAVLGATGTLGYAIGVPKDKDRLTDFYILGPEGKAENYPEEVLVGQEVNVIVGIFNHEHDTVSYRIEVRGDEVRSNEVGPLVLGHDEKWEGIVSFTPYRAGDSQKVEFVLYRDNDNEPWVEPVHVWIDVKEQR